MAVLMQTANIAQLQPDKLRRQWNNCPSGFAYTFVLYVTSHDCRNGPGYLPAASLALLSLGWLGVRIIYSSRRKRVARTNIWVLRSIAANCEYGTMVRCRWRKQRSQIISAEKSVWWRFGQPLARRIVRTVGADKDFDLEERTHFKCEVFDEPAEPIRSIRQHNKP